MARSLAAAEPTQQAHGGEGLAVFDHVPGHLIRCCRQIAVAIFLEEFSSFNITSVQYAALVGARANPGLDQRALGDLIAVDRSTIGTLLGRLEEAGLIYREMPPHNQRIKQVFITEAGSQLLDDSSDAIDRVQARIMAPLSKGEGEQLLMLLRKLFAGNNELSRAPAKGPHASSARSGGA